MTNKTNLFGCFNSLPEAIRHVVSMDVWIPLSLHNVEDLLFWCGADIRHEKGLLQWNRFSRLFAAEIRRQFVDTMRSFPPGRRHLGGFFATIKSERHYVWRAADHDGEISEPNVMKNKDKGAVWALLKGVLNSCGRSEAIVTDGLRSYPAAMRNLSNLRRGMGYWVSNRVESSHLLFRRRERAMQRFRKTKSLEMFEFIHASFNDHFNSEQHLINRQTYRIRRSTTPAEWHNLAVRKSLLLN